MEWRSPSPPRRVRGAAAPQHRMTRLREPGDWKVSEMEVEEEFESGSEEAGGWRGSDIMFLSIVFSFCHILSGGEGEKGKGLPFNDGKVVHGLLRGCAGQGQDTAK